MDSDKRYKEVIKEIESNIELLKEKLKQHQVKQSKQPENWGFVGDVSYINTKIENIIETLR